MTGLLLLVTAGGDGRVPFHAKARYRDDDSKTKRMQQTEISIHDCRELDDGSQIESV